MTTTRDLGRGLFYTRDSEGKSDLAPQQYVAWARGEASRLGVAFGGTAEAITSMIRDHISQNGDLFLDYGISGNILSRPGFDAFLSIGSRRPERESRLHPASRPNRKAARPQRRGPDGNGITVCGADRGVDGPWHQTPRSSRGTP